jgi:hypothetical protein
VEDVNWVLDKCAVCGLNDTNRSKGPLTPIVSNSCLDRVQVDLMDFQASPDHGHKWILHIKDHFSRMSWLYPLRTKQATEVAEMINAWIGHNG